jgi:DNA-binding transcriptional LysR family regulator
VLPAAATALLPKSLALFRTRAPHANVIVREGPFEVLLPELRARKVDLLLGTLKPGHVARDLTEKVLSSPPLTLAARKGHPLSRLRRITWRQLAECQWVLPPVASFLRQPLESEFERNGIPVPTNCLETNATHLICSYLAMTDAIAFLQEDLLRHISRRSGLCTLPLRLTGLLRPTGVMWSQGYPLEPLAQRFLGCLEETAGSIAVT